MKRDGVFFFVGLALGVLIGAVSVGAARAQGSVTHDGPWQRSFTITDGLTSGFVTITTAPLPKCDDGWTLVLDTSMQPMCARELRKPK